MLQINKNIIFIKIGGHSDMTKFNDIKNKVYHLPFIEKDNLKIYKILSNAYKKLGDDANYNFILAEYYFIQEKFQIMSIKHLIQFIKLKVSLARFIFAEMENWGVRM